MPAVNEAREKYVEDLKNRLGQEASTSPMAATAGQAIGLLDKPAEIHPREVLLRDLGDLEQRLLDKLFAVRRIRNDYLFLGRDEAKRILEIIRLSRVLADGGGGLGQY